MQCQCEYCAETPGPTYTEAHRHACEVRYAASLPSKDARRRYLDGMDASRRQRIINGLKAIAR